jgi:thiol-disulfide isomerase/thioredoxin
MKNNFLLLVLLLITTTVFSQTSDTTSKKIKTIPPFRVQLMDSTTWFSRSNLSPKKPTWIIYFSPDCGHCQMETEEIISNIKSLEKVQILMVTSRPFQDVKNFYDRYLLKRFPSIKMAVDPSRLIVNYYNVEYTPYSALYDKKGKLIKAFKDAPKVEEIVSLIK